jgi:tetratricopeptide (TPR) repeat protein
MIGIRRRRTAVLAVCALLIVAGLAAATLGAGDLPGDQHDWIQVKTANFLLWSDASERRTRAIAAELEQMRGALLQVSPSLAFGSAYPSYIFVFKNRYAFTPYLFRIRGKRVEASGYFLQRPWANYVAVDGDPRVDAMHSVRHEYAHYLLRNNYAHLPLWLDEGLAEYYGTFQLVDREMRVGLPIFDHINWLRANSLIPLQQLLAVDHNSKDYHEGSRVGVFYAESWALTHYLLLGNPARRPQLVRMVKLMESGVKQEQAFAQAFGADYDGLQHELVVYANRKVFSYEVTPVAAGSDLPVGVQRLAWADVLYHLGDLLLNTGREQQAEAAEHFRAALAADPRQGLAAAGLGEIEDEEGRGAEARALYEKAVQLAPGDPFVHFLLGRSLLQLALAANDEKVLAERSAAELARATELAPGFGEAWSHLGVARLGLDPAAPQTLEALETAHRLLPKRNDVTLNLAMAYARAGARSKAEALIALARAASASPDSLERVREELLRADYEAAGKLAADGKVEEAVHVLERVVADTRRDDLRGAAQATLDELRARLKSHLP